MFFYFYFYESIFFFTCTLRLYLFFISVLEPELSCFSIFVAQRLERLKITELDFALSEESSSLAHSLHLAFNHTANKNVSSEI